MNIAKGQVLIRESCMGEKHLKYKYSYNNFYNSQNYLGQYLSKHAINF
jgi:hypothetical protein